MHGLIHIVMNGIDVIDCPAFRHEAGLVFRSHKVGLHAVEGLAQIPTLYKETFEVILGCIWYDRSSMKQFLVLSFNPRAIVFDTRRMVMSVYFYVLCGQTI